MKNSLADVHPELVYEWADRNLPLTPDTVTYGSNRQVWWKGACGHEWQASIKSRSSGENCPVCSGKRILRGINLEYTFPSGEKIKLLDDTKIYLGYQVEKPNSDRCYGLVADNSCLLVCEYGCEGADPEIIIYKKWMTGN